jgi:hypothetical protein
MSDGVMDIDNWSVLQQIEFRQKAVALLGKELVFMVRRIAQENQTQEAVKYDTLLLGGRLRVSLEFDFREER